MTVSSTSSDTRYSGNGSTTAFATGFTFYASSTLRVSLIQVSTGTETVQTLTTHYTVSGGNGSTGTVTMLTAPASGYTLVIKRDEPYTQLTDLLDNDPLPAPVLEGAYDKLVMQIQQVYRRTLTAIQAPATFNPNTDTPYTMSAPTNGTVPVGNGTGWDATALASVNTSAVPVSIVSLQNRDLLEYDSGTTSWKNQTLSTVLKRIATTTGDLLYNLSGTISRLAIGTEGYVLTSQSGAPAWAALPNIMLRDYITGFTLSTAGSSTSFGVAAGAAADYGNTIMLSVASAYTKTTGAWAVGSGNGSLDEGTTGNSLWYHAYVIRRPDTGVTDYLTSLCPNRTATATMTIASPAVVTWADHGLQIGSAVVFSTTGALPTGVTAGTRYYVISSGFGTGTFQFSATQGGAAINTSGSQSGTHTATSTPKLPTNYTQYRRIGSMKTNGSAQWATFYQKGNRFYLTGVNDFTAAGATSAATLRAFSVPIGVPVGVIGYAIASANPASGGAQVTVSPAGLSTNAHLSGYADGSASSVYGTGTFYDMATNYSAQLYVAVPANAGSVSLNTTGWIDLRGMDGQ